MLKFSGQVHSFFVTINQIVTTERFRKLSIDERKCRLPYENANLKIFNIYTKSNCEYECAIERASRVCLCRPWNIPRPDTENITFCSTFGNICFMKFMSDSSPFQNCNCSVNCEATTYSITKTSSVIDFMSNPCDIFGVKELEPFMPRLLIDYFTNGNPNPYKIEFCRYFAKKYVTIVEVQMASQYITRSMMDVKITFENQLASIGNFTL